MGRSRTPAIRVLVIVIAAAVCVAGFAVYIGAIGNPAIARMRGLVSSVRPSDDEVEICIANPVDAGTTYGSREFDTLECWTGIVDDPRPAVGACVVVQSQGHVSELVIEPTTGCTANGGATQGAKRGAKPSQPTSD